MLKSCCFETKVALLFGGLMFAISALLSGCWSSKSVPPPATDNPLGNAESKLDYLQDKRLSRASAAVSVALLDEDVAENTIVKNELSIAKMLLGEPTNDDLAWAVNRAKKDDAAYYLAQLDDTKKFLEKVKQANDAYEAEKARLQAEHAAGLAQLKMELKAKDDEKWTWTAIGLFLAGMAAIYFGASFKQKALGGLFIIGAAIAGAIPRIQSEPWFLYAIGGSVALSAVSFVGLVIWKAKREAVVCVHNETPEAPKNDPASPNA